MTSSSGRPVLVWIICLFHFIGIPLALVWLIVAPLVYAHRAPAEKLTVHDLQEQLAAATDVAQRNQLAERLQLMQEAQTRAKHFQGRRIGNVVFTIATSILSLAAAVFLFQLRLLAFHLFFANFVIGMLREFYEDMVTGLPHISTQAVHVIVGIKVVTWALSIAILLYVWSLSHRGVLS